MVTTLVGLLCAGCQGAARKPGHYPVGVRTLSYPQPNRGPDLTVEVWYPTLPNTPEVPQGYGEAYLGWAARDAPLCKASQYPLMVLSHGLRGSRYDLSWLAEGLAAEGMIVAAVDHPGSDALTYDDRQASKLWVRAQTLSHVIDSMLSNPFFGPWIDTKRIAAAGHSAGGSTVLVLAGAQMDPDRFKHRFHEPAPLKRVGWDPRVHAIVTLAPGTGSVFTSEGISQVNIPALIISGTADWHTPEASNAGYYAAHLKKSQWHRIKGAAHYTFKPMCTLYAKVRMHQICLDSMSINRARVHDQVIQWSHAFLNRTWNAPA